MGIRNFIFKVFCGIVDVTGEHALAPKGDLGESDASSGKGEALCPSDSSHSPWAARPALGKDALDGVAAVSTATESPWDWRAEWFPSFPRKTWARTSTLWVVWDLFILGR